MMLGVNICFTFLSRIFLKCEHFDKTTKRVLRKVIIRNCSKLNQVLNFVIMNSYLKLAMLTDT